MFLNNKQSKLLRLAEQFLIVENVKIDKNIRVDFLYKTLIDKNQTNLYQRHLKNDLNKLDKNRISGLDYYKSQYMLQEIMLRSLIKSGEIVKTDNYNELQHYLNLNYILGNYNFI